MIQIDVRLTRSTGFRVETRFSTPDQGVCALFGRSGCGKTTLIQMVAGAIRPDQGHIGVGETTFFDADKGIDLPMEKRRVGYVFQDARLFPHMSVATNLDYGARRAGPHRPIAFAAVVEMLGIGHLLKRRPHTLSGGERQRVAIGRALLSQPRLLLMDEPLASLDEHRKAEILPYLERLRDDLRLPILYVSHSLDEVLRLADTMVAMAEGRALACGPVAQVMSHPDLAPVVGRFDFGAILDCTVVRHDPALALSTLAFADGCVRVPRVDQPPGAAVRARIRARDVALALSQPVDVSLTNCLKGEIRELRREEGPFCDVDVLVGGSVIRAMITTESAVRLGLRPAMTVWLMIKAVAVDTRAAPFAPSSP